MSRINLASLAAAVLLLSGATGASALTIDYSGSFTLCTGTCNSFAALGGPGGADNTVASLVTGSVTIDAAAGSAFTTADITGFSFEVFNSAAPGEAANFDGGGNLLNGTTANPLPLDERLATVEGSGMLDASGGFASGDLAFAFTQPPFSNNGAVIYFDLATGNADGFLFVDVVQFASIAGDFTPRPIPVPGAVWLLASGLLGLSGLGRKHGKGDR